jgi:hypothetical protein
VSGGQTIIIRGGSEPAGRVLDRYRLVKQLGSGGFGTVYASRDERLERDVAVKVLPRERIVGGRFEREARAAARLSHPAIVTLYEAAVDDDGAYLVSELVRGRTLEQLLRRGRCSDRDLISIGIALADALEHAHAEGVVHRDVKPSNILVPSRRSQETPAAKLTDFGIARLIGGDTITGRGEVIGTLDYMAPEQAEGRDAGPAADLYSLALVLYEGLSGVNPLGQVRGSPGQRRLGTHLPPIRRQRRDLPRGLAAALDRALRPRPGERGRLDELRAALCEALPDSSELAGVVAPARIVAPTIPASPRLGPEWEALPQGRSSRATEPQAGGPSALRRRSEAGPPPPWSQRGLAALAAGGSAAWLAGHLLHSLPGSPAALGLVAALLVLLAPRAGWTLCVALLSLLAALQWRPGGALLLLAAFATAGILLAGAPRLWPLPAAAVALGLLGLAPAWPALVGASRLPAPRRAGLAAAGLVFACAAAALAGEPGILWEAPHAQAHASTLASAGSAVEVLTGAIRAGLLAGAVVWALAAVALGPLRRRARGAAGVALLGAWAVLTTLLTEAVGLAPLHGALLGTILAAGLAAAPALAGLLDARRGRAVEPAATP